MKLNAQTPESSNSLLWSISGNGLKKPSFLFGTIHLQDKRVFHFTDSVYFSIQATEGFALEIHPDSMLMNMFLNKEKEKAVPLKEVMNKKDFEKLKGKLKKELKVDPENLTVKDAYSLKQKIIRPETKEDDMPSIVDLYLYSIALDQGKAITGLEKLSDQTELFENIEEAFDPSELISDHTLEKNFVENMIQIYVNQELDKIMQMQTMSGELEEDLILNRRNKVMADKMDSLMHSIPYFVAVGAAHLPGPHGIIELLRQKGYTVQPVHSSKKLPAGFYQYKNENKWEEFTDGAQGYSISMPGKVIPLTLQDGFTTMNNHFDLVNMKMYFIASFPVFNKSVNTDSLIRSFSEIYEKKSDKNITTGRKWIDVQNLRGMEFITRDQSTDYWMKMQIISNGEKLYLLGVASQKSHTLDGSDVSRYFESFRPIKDSGSRKPFILRENGFEVMFPVAPSKKQTVDSQDSTIHIYQYSAPDLASGAYYVFVVTETNPTYVITSDSAYFNSVLSGFMERTKMKILHQADTVVKGYKAKSLLALNEAGNVLTRILIVKRGSQVFNLITSAEKGNIDHADIAAYFRSFDFLPYKNENWAKHVSPGREFTSWTPGNIIKKTGKDLNGISSYYAFDSVLSVTYEVTVDTLNRYIWESSDTSLLHHWMNQYVYESHPLVSYRYITAGSKKSVEFLTTCDDSRLIKKARISYDGRKKMIAFAFLPEEFIDEPNQIKFFNGLEFTDAFPAPDIEHSTPLPLLDALGSADSLLRLEAYHAMDEVVFAKEDLPLLLDRARMGGKMYATEYNTVSDVLLTKVSELVDSGSVRLLESCYLKAGNDAEFLKYDILSLLAGIHSRESYDILKDLLKSGAPSSGNPSRFISNLYDSPDLTISLYPVLLSLGADSLLALPLFGLYKELMENEYLTREQLKADYAVLEKGIESSYKKILIGRDEENWWYVFPLMRLLATLDTKESVDWLYRLLALGNTEIKEEAAMQLLQKGKKVPAEEWKAIASDKKLRVGLYRQLRENKKSKLFPSRYLNQQSFSEGLIWESFEDEEPAEVTYLGEEYAEFNGRKEKFHLYKVVFEYEGEKSQYLGVAGPFSKDRKKILPDNHYSGCYYQEEYVPGLNKRLLKAYLAEMANTTDEPVSLY